MASDAALVKSGLEGSTEVAQWEADEGLLQPHDAVLQKYFQGRDALIDQEDKQRSDQAFRELLSPMAREACAIVSQIRFEEQQTVWKTTLNEDANDGLAQSRELFPGMMHSLARKTAETTKLFDIVQRMPKGALLHCHLAAMIDPAWLCREALATDGIHMAAEQPLHSPADRGTQPFSFRFTKEQSQPDISIWSDSYVPGAWIPMQSAADSFPDGGREGFVAWFKSRSSITLEESLDHHLGVYNVWHKFQSCFRILVPLVFYEPLFRKFLRHFFGGLMRDGIRYVEIRETFYIKYRREASEESDEGYEELFRVFGDELNKFRSSPAGQGFWGARVIWTTIRSFGRKAIVDNMYECIETKMTYPELIAGYDLVGHEDPGASLAELMPLLFHFRKLCAEARVNIPFFFHAGETTTTGTEVDHNLFDAILLGSRRIGHGFSLYKHPILMQMTKDRRICVECCPVSNEILRLTSSVTAHPLPAMLAHGVPVALCNDDPGILGYGSTGMSHDYWQVLQSIESLGLEGLGSLAENSIRHSAFEDQDPKTWAEDVKKGAYGDGIRAQRMQEWKKEWERFAQWVVMEHGVDVDLEEQD